MNELIEILRKDNEKKTDYAELEKTTKGEDFWKAPRKVWKEVQDHMKDFIFLNKKAWGDDMSVAMLYSVHMLIDALEKNLDAIEKETEVLRNNVEDRENHQVQEQWILEQKETLKRILLMLVADKGYLFFETRDMFAGEGFSPFRGLYINREYTLNFKLLKIDQDQMIDLIMAFSHRTENGYTGLTKGRNAIRNRITVEELVKNGEKLWEVVNYERRLAKEYYNGADKAGLSIDDFEERIHYLVRHTLEESKQKPILDRQKFIEKFQNGYKECPDNLFQKKISDQELDSYYDEEMTGVALGIHSLREFLEKLFDAYNTLVEDVKEQEYRSEKLWRSILTSKKQWEMYEQREKFFEWLPAARRPLASLLEKLGDESFNYKDALEEDSLIRRDILQKEQLDQYEAEFVDLVEYHYRKRRSIVKKNYKKSQEREQRILGWLKCSLMEEMPASPPIVAYLCLCTPSRKVQTSLKEAAQKGNLSTLKTLAEKKEDVRFFYDLISYYGKILVPEERNISEWMTDFDAITGYLDFVQEAFEESMQQRYSEPVIRIFNKIEGEDYPKAFFKFNEINSKLRKAFEDEVEGKSDWIKGYRKIWENISNKHEFTGFLNGYIEKESEVWKKVKDGETDDGNGSQRVLTVSLIEKNKAISAMVEDVLRKENIKLSCRKVRAIMQRCFPMEASGCENIAEQSQPSQGGIPIKEEPSTTP